MELSSYAITTAKFPLDIPARDQPERGKVFEWAAIHQAELRAKGS
jgi:hypothetical protein